MQACVRANPGLPEVDEPFIIGNRLRHPEGGHTHLAYECSVAGFNNANESFLYHLIPMTEPEFDPVDLGPIQRTLKNDLATLTAGTSDTHGLITGGNSYDDSRQDLFATLSERLFTGIQSTLASITSVKPSIIWGRRASEFNKGLSAVYTRANDTWHLFAGEHIQRLQDLQKTFRHIFIAPGDTLELPAGTRIKGPIDLSDPTA
jgi:hypothetical protein